MQKNNEGINFQAWYVETYDHTLGIFALYLLIVMDMRMDGSFIFF